MLKPCFACQVELVVRCSVRSLEVYFVRSMLCYNRVSDGFVVGSYLVGTQVLLMRSSKKH